MDLREAVASAFGEMLKGGNTEEKKVRVGRISSELESEFFVNRNEAKLAAKNIEAQIHAFVEKLEVESSLLKFENKKMELWEKVYDELGLTQEERGLKYKINHDTRVITRIDKVELEEEVDLDFFLDSK